MSLTPLGETSDLIRWYGEAVGAFASAWATPVPPVSDANAPVREGQIMAEVLAQAMVTVLRRPARLRPWMRSLRVVREAVDLYRELAAHDPELFQQAYIDKRAALRRLLPQDDITFDL
ncbi:hypothetical protein [Nonomuraea jabiensis]|uniref:hypothetical protein n=1 Tax=Nonomuraea jabiensis TaxID=882448 RepID=UPI0036AF12E5